MRWALSNKPYYCYVLWSEDASKFYIGITEDVRKRLDDHNSGISKWTKRHAGSWVLVWQQRFESLGEARKLENRLKRQKTGRGFWTLTGLAPSEFKRAHNSDGASPVSVQKPLPVFCRLSRFSSLRASPRDS